MRLKIGIPRSLYYYKFAAFWESFFPALGAEVVVSDRTNKRILDDGVKSCVDEACLPIKLFYGHVLNLTDRVDYILVPRFTSISRNEYICPEFGGLPDMIRHTLKGIPKIIDTEVNMRKSDKGGMKAAIRTAALLGADRRTAVKAYRTAVDGLIRERIPFITKENDAKSEKRPQEGNSLKGEKRPQEGNSLKSEKCPQEENSLKSEKRPQKLPPELKGCFRSCRGVRSPCIGVIGHPYNVYDRYISMDLLGKLSKYGIETRTVEMVDEDAINAHASKLAKPMFWNYGRMAYGAAHHMAETGEVEGFICISSFGCGIDSFVNDLIERSIRKKFRIPFITMTIDEHSGEAGFNTRLEAFVDMLQWRRQNEDYISASG